MYPPRGAPAPACPVCGTPVTGPPVAPCPRCGLPAAGQAATVVDRLTATLGQLARDREDLLVTLRAAAPGPPAPVTELPPAPEPGTPVGPPPTWAPPAGPPVTPAPPTATPWWPPASPAAPAPAPPRRQVSPQQVLLGLGALLLVAGALAFVALGWTRFGLAFQVAVMVTGTAAAGAASAVAARRGLRATEEALAAAGTALLAVDLGAAHARGLAGLDQLPLRTWTAVSCLVVAVAALGLGRLTRSTVTWPLVALLALQPVPLLLLPDDLLTGPTGVAVALAGAAADLAGGTVLRPSVGRVARALAALWGGVGVLAGLLMAATGTPAESWTATALLVVAAAAAVVVLRRPRVTGGPLPPVWVTAGAGGVVGLALVGSLETTGPSGAVVAAALGLGVLSTAALVSGPRPLTGPLRPSAGAELRAGLLAAGAALTVVGAGVLGDADRLRPLAVLALVAGVPAALTALRVPAVRDLATGVALLAPAAAVLLAREADWLAAPAAGLLLALVAAGAFGVATWRAGAPEEVTAAAAGALTGFAAGVTTASVGAWGQVGLQLGVVGVAAGCYALVAHRRPVAVVAVADLVLASWIAVGGAGVETPEAYTLPAAAGLLVLALPRIRAGAPSWAAEGAAAGVALVPSALAVVGSPTALRLVLVVAGALALVVVGTLAHRQAPFVLGAGTLALVVVARLGPYAPLLPRWLTLAVAGLLLLVLGATYERRRQQAREAVAWVSQLG